MTDRTETSETSSPEPQRDWSKLDDSVLIDAHLNGHPEAFEVLFRKHSGRISKLVLSIAKNPSLVEDIVQEIFLIVYRYLPRFRGQSSFKTWLYRIAVNEAVRSTSRSRRWVGLGEREVHEVTPAAGVLIVDKGPSPECVFVEGEQRAKLEQAMDGLKPHHRAILTLYYLEDLSVQEVADVLEIPEGSVKSRLYYARENLKKVLQPALRETLGDAGRSHHAL